MGIGFCLDYRDGEAFARRLGRVIWWLSILFASYRSTLPISDEWLLTGHCAYIFDCERWKTGCWHCPDLGIYPAIRRDSTDYNWERKREIYAKCRLYVVTPSHWLMRKVEQSMFAPAVVESRIIPNGVDLTLFHPTNRQAVRAALGIAQGAKVLLFAANGIRRIVLKDYKTMRAAVAEVARLLYGQSVLFIALGENGLSERIGQDENRFLPESAGSRGPLLSGRRGLCTCGTG